LARGDSVPIGSRHAAAVNRSTELFTELKLRGPIHHCVRQRFVFQASSNLCNAVGVAQIYDLVITIERSASKNETLA
jgi:hypothetical protein